VTSKGSGVAATRTLATLARAARNSVADENRCARMLRRVHQRPRIAAFDDLALLHDENICRF
jgi:hypothetical protein